MQPINRADGLALFSAFSFPCIAARCNGHDLKVAKVLGEFVWHDHPDTDDVLMVLSAAPVIDLPDGAVTQRPGEVFGVPKGGLRIEPTCAPNTGDPETVADKVRV